MILPKCSRRVEADCRADFNSPAMKKALKAAFFRLLGSLPHAEHQKCWKMHDFWQLSSVLCGLPLLNRPRDKAPLLYLQPQDDLQYHANDSPLRQPPCQTQKRLLAGSKLAPGYPRKSDQPQLSGTKFGPG